MLGASEFYAFQCYFEGGAGGSGDDYIGPPCAIGGAGLFLAMAILLLQGGEVVAPNLSLLGHYLVGFDASWPGALIGMVEAGLGGFAAGWLLARLINFVIAAEEARILRGAEEQAVDLFEGSDR